MTADPTAMPAGTYSGATDRARRQRAVGQCAGDTYDQQHRRQPFAVTFAYQNNGQVPKRGRAEPDFSREYEFHGRGDYGDRRQLARRPGYRLRAGHSGRLVEHCGGRPWHGARNV